MANRTYLEDEADFIPQGNQNNREGDDNRRRGRNDNRGRSGNRGDDNRGRGDRRDSRGDDNRGRGDRRDSRGDDNRGRSRDNNSGNRYNYEQNTYNTRTVRDDVEDSQRVEERRNPRRGPSTLAKVAVPTALVLAAGAVAIVAVNGALDRSNSRNLHANVSADGQLLSNTIDTGVTNLVGAINANTSATYTLNNTLDDHLTNLIAEQARTADEVANAVEALENIGDSLDSIGAFLTRELTLDNVAHLGRTAAANATLLDWFTFTPCSTTANWNREDQRCAKFGVSRRTTVDQLMTMGEEVALRIFNDMRRNGEDMFKVDTADGITRQVMAYIVAHNPEHFPNYLRYPHLLQAEIMEQGFNTLGQVLGELGIINRDGMAAIAAATDAAGRRVATAQNNVAAAQNRNAAATRGVEQALRDHTTVTIQLSQAEVTASNGIEAAIREASRMQDANAQLDRLQRAQASLNTQNLINLWGGQLTAAIDRIQTHIHVHPSTTVTIPPIVIPPIVIPPINQGPGGGWVVEVIVPPGQESGNGSGWVEGVGPGQGGSGGSGGSSGGTVTGVNPPAGGGTAEDEDEYGYVDEVVVGGDSGSNSTVTGVDPEQEGESGTVTGVDPEQEDAGYGTVIGGDGQEEEDEAGYVFIVNDQENCDN